MRCVTIILSLWCCCLCFRSRREGVDAVHVRVIVVQHPQGADLQVAEGYIPADHDEQGLPHLFKYKTKTLTGSSGAPITDERRRVVGIHIGERSPSEQLGVSFQSIFEDLQNE